MCVEAVGDLVEEAGVVVPSNEAVLHLGRFVADVVPDAGTVVFDHAAAVEDEPSRHRDLQPARLPPDVVSLDVVAVDAALAHHGVVAAGRAEAELAVILEDAAPEEVPSPGEGHPGGVGALEGAVLHDPAHGAGSPLGALAVSQYQPPVLGVARGVAEPDAPEVDVGRRRRRLQPVRPDAPFHLRLSGVAVVRQPDVELPGVEVRVKCAVSHLVAAKHLPEQTVAGDHLLGPPDHLIIRVAGVDQTVADREPVRPGMEIDRRLRAGSPLPFLKRIRACDDDARPRRRGEHQRALFGAAPFHHDLLAVNARSDPDGIAGPRPVHSLLDRAPGGGLRAGSPVISSGSDGVARAEGVGREGRQQKDREGETMGRHRGLRRAP